jgi:hypothetical protein
MVKFALNGKKLEKNSTYAALSGNKSNPFLPALAHTFPCFQHFKGYP